VYALVPPVSEGGWQEVQMNMTYVSEHAKTWYMLQIQWHNMANDNVSFNKEMESDSLRVECCAVSKQEDQSCIVGQ
jgi:hypothetical protein